VLGAFLIIFIIFKWKRNDIIKAALTFFITLCLAGFIDYLTWGNFFISYYNNYLFNKIYNVGAILGTSPAIYYPAALAFTSMGIFWIVGLISLLILRKTWLFLICIIIVIVSHSFIPHKEYRFIFLVIPLLLMLFSVVIMQGISLFDGVSKESNFLAITICIFLLISSAGSMNKLPFQFLVYRNSVFSRQEILKAYLTLFESKDLYAILNIAKPWTLTGGYYYLHRDVPIYTAFHFRSQDVGNFSPYISHMICSINEGDIAGFRSMIRFQSIEIRKQTHPPPKYDRLPIDTQNVLVEEIDGKYDPTKLPR
jgi:hypothetical protein